MVNLSDFVISEDATLLQAVEQIAHNRSRAVIVVSGQKALGVLSEGDIMRTLLRETDIHEPIKSFVVYSFKYLTERNYAKAYDLFSQYLFTLLPVVDEDFHLVDVITLGEVLQHFRGTIA